MNFRRWVVFTFFIHVLVVAVDKGGGLILYLLTAEQADQHGKSGIIASLPFVLMAIANLGLATSLVYYLRRGVYTAQQAFSTTLTVASVWGGLIALLALVTTLYVLPAINPSWTFSPWLVVPWCAVVPLLLIASYGNSVQLAVERVADYGVVHLIASLAFLPAFFAVFWYLGSDVANGDVPMAVAWGRLLSTAIVVVLVLLLVRRVVKLRFGIHRPFLADGVRFGWKANLTSTLTYLNHRIDLILLGALFVPTAHMIPTVIATPNDVQDMLSRWTESVSPLPQPFRQEFFQQSALLAKVALAQVAYYGMAVTWAELVWHFPEAMRDLFFSKVAGSSSEEARRLTPVLCRLGLAVSVAGGVAVVYLLDPIMGTITWMARGSGEVWYSDWSHSVNTALVLLTPGTVAFTVSKVLQADLAARGYLPTCVHAQVIVLVTMLGLDFVLMPEYGAAGAALASTIAYTVSTLYTLWAYTRSTGASAVSCLFVQRSDFRYIVQIVNAVLVKLRWRRG